MNFSNLNSDKDLQEWLQFSIAECAANYPLPSHTKATKPVAVDIGANVGGFCVNAHKWFDKVYAFEPLTENYFILEEVLKKLNIKNVEVYNTAIYGSSNQELILRACEGNHTQDVTCASFDNVKFSNLEQKCETISLTDMFDALEINKVDYLKIDCEGSEYEIFENFNDYHKIDLIAMEVHEFFGEKRKSDLLANLGEHFYYVDMSSPHISDLNNLRESVIISPIAATAQDHLFLVNKGGRRLIDG